MPPPPASPLPQGTFADQVAFVTGGGTGLGLATSLLLGRLGARVACASRDVAHHSALLEHGRSEGFEVLSVAMDVREPSQVKAAVRATLARFGRIDVLINNAAGNFVRPALLLAPKAFATVIDIALTGVFTVSREVGKHMVERGGGGSIVNISAPYAATGKPGVIHSACAKAGVDALTKTLAAEWASHGIRVNAIAPGPFVSQGAAERLWPSEAIEQAVKRQIPLGRFGTAEEVAEVVAWAASAYAPWLTGSIVVLDGGWSLPASLVGGLSIEAVRRRRGVPSPDEGPETRAHGGVTPD